MRFRVTKKQPNSKMCLVCGLSNDLGLHSAFYELDSGELLAVFTPHPTHQSYPHRLHGGIVSAILDETIGRAILIRHAGEVWGVTVDLSVRFRKPIALDQQLRVIGRITSEGRRFFRGSGELLLADGSIAAEGEGRYVKQPLDRISDFDPEQQDWHVTATPDDPEFVDL